MADQLGVAGLTGGFASTEVTFHRDVGTLIVDVLLCLILLALPIGALIVAIMTIRGSVRSTRPRSDGSPRCCLR